MKKVLLITTLFATMVGGFISAIPQTHAADTYYKDTTVSASIISGGIDITASNVAFGSVKIGEPDPTSPLNLTVQNKTGSAGLTVTVADITASSDATGVILNYTPTSGTMFSVGSTAAQAFKTVTVNNAIQTFNGNLVGKMPASTKVGAINRTLHWVVNPTV